MFLPLLSLSAKLTISVLTYNAKVQKKNETLKEGCPSVITKKKLGQIVQGFQGHPQILQSGNPVVIMSALYKCCNS